MAITISKDIRFRIYLLFLMVFIVAVAVVLRIAQIQFVQGDKWRAKSKEQSTRYFDVSAIRGNIYSQNRSLLATSVPIYNIYWDSKVVDKKTFFSQVDSLAIAYHAVFPHESIKSFKSRIIKAYDTKNRYFMIRRRVSYSEMKAISAMPIFRAGKYRGGLISEKTDYRKRPYQTLAKRTIGTFNRSQNAYVVGLEGAYNKYLKGEDGIRIKQKTAGGWRPLYLFDETIKEPVNGMDVITTIDIDLQDVAENSLYRELMKNKADWGCAILMEVKTGKIKAIANLKADTATNSYYEGFNYAIGAATEPGSTFKLASMMAALEDKKVNPDEIISTGDGSFKYYGKTIHDSHHGGFGDITASEVLEKSSNIGVFKIVLRGYESEPKKFIDKIYAMGLNKPLGLEIKGEAKPYIKTPEDKTWSKLSLPWMSIGYELQLTPMQVLTFYNAVANDGKKVKPIFVTELSKTGKTTKTFEPVVLNPQISSLSTIKKVKKMLEGVVQNGTATMLKYSPYPIAGKTGTAQIYNRSYNKRNYQASFVGYFPADHPKYSCIVVINNPNRGQYYASSVAVPVFKDISDKIYATDLDIQIHQEEDTVLQAPNSKVGQASDVEGIYRALSFDIVSKPEDASYEYGVAKADSVSMFKRQLTYGLMPNVKYMTARDAIFLLEEMGLKVEIQGAGKVVEQSLTAGQRVVKGDVVTLKLRF
jgi:cell division protein FtsI (penicillin-binding protein 3)